ncbi:MAG TPA: hypothetical protein VEB86_10925 [Chryseosolibacter sp.]|nr:hypothetical protein [Chryseosolibacter sp.]
MSGFENNGSGVDWTTGSNPSVTLTNGQDSKNLRGGIGNGRTGNYYDITVNFDIVHNSGSGPSAEINVLLYTSGMVLIGSDSQTYLSAGNKSFNTVINATSEPDYIVVVVENNSVLSSSLSFDINSITVSSGTVTTTEQEITEPDGWKDAVLKLERHPEFKSLVEYFEGEFIFYGDNGEVNGGINFIKDVERVYGLDANINILIEIDPNDDDNYEEVFTGLLKLSGMLHMPNNTMRVPIVRNDFWSKFINRFDTPVDVMSAKDLDGNYLENVYQPITLNLPPQKLRMAYRATQKTPGYCPVENETSHPFIQFDLYNVDLNEIQEKNNFEFAFNVAKPAQLFYAKYAGEYTFDISYYLTVMFADPDTEDCGLNNISGVQWDFDIYIQVNSSEPKKYKFIQVDHAGTGGATSDDAYSVFTWSGMLNLIEGDSVFVYAEVNNTSFQWPNAQLVMLGNESGALDWTGMAFGPGPNFDSALVPSVDSHFYVSADTVYPETTTEGFLLHDAAYAICQRIIGFD